MKKIFVATIFATIITTTYAMEEQRAALEQQQKDYEELETHFTTMLILCTKPSEKSISDFYCQDSKVRRHSNKFLASLLWQVKYRDQMWAQSFRTKSHHERECNLLSGNSHILELLKGEDDPCQKQKAHEVWQEAYARVYNKHRNAFQLCEHIREITARQAEESKTVQVPIEYAELAKKCTRICSEAQLNATDSALQIQKLFTQLKGDPNQLFAQLAWQQTTENKKPAEEALSAAQGLSEEITNRRNIFTDFSLSNPLYDARDRAHKIYYTLVEIDKLYGQK